MSDLISRKALIDYIKVWEIGCAVGHDQKTFLRAIQDQPPVEAKPVVHGEWEQLCDKYFSTVIPTISRCSVCGKKYNLANIGYNFCPECGADMREKVEDGRDK